MIWLIILVLAVGVLGLLLEPYLRKPTVSRGLDDQDYLVAQLKDIEREHSAGLLSDEQAKEAKVEAQRRLLAAQASDSKPTPVSGLVARRVSIGLVALAPLAAIILYAALGNPFQEVTPKGLEIAQRANPEMQNLPSLTEAVTALEKKLADAPDDLDGWVMLGQSYSRLGRFADAAEAFGKARIIQPEQAYLYASEGEALTMANDGNVTDAAKIALEKAIVLDEKEPRARFYLALASYQRGEKEQALDALVLLSNEAPAGVQWASIVRSQIEAIANELGRPLDELGLNAPAQPENPAEAIAQMGDDERNEMIRGMVSTLAARLETDPDDLEGWTMLARSYAVIGEMDKSAEAYARGSELAPDDLNLRLGRAEALLTVLRQNGLPIDDEAQAAIDEVSRLDSEHPFALYFQGLAASQRGDKPQARSYWERLLATMPEGSPDAAGIQQMLDTL